MATVSDKKPENVAGKFYVDDQCIDCDLCRETSPQNFTRDEESGQSYVYKQPETEEEKLLCSDAMAACPVSSIGNDGDK
ncbi:MAG: ferredoxin [Candidatus Paceibacterota bacterium]|jgi:ferredoxin